MKTFILTALILIIGWLTGELIRAQTGVMRLEFPAELDKNPYELVSLDTSGLLMFYAQAAMVDDENRNWHFMLYDTNLFKIWETDVPVLDGSRYQQSFMQDGKVDLFFFNPGKIKSGNNNFQMSELNVNSGIIDHFTGLLPDVAEIKGFFVSGDIAVTACNMKNEQAAVFFIDTRKKNYKVFMTDFQDQNFVEDLRADPFNGSALLLLSNYTSRRQNLLLMLELDMSGKVIRECPIQVVLPSKYLNSGRIYPIGPTNNLVIGTYSNFSSKIPSEDDYYGLESAGYFITRFEDSTQQYMNYYNFMELQNIRPAMSARDYLKLAKKKNREESDYSVDYEILLHSIKLINKEYTIMSEAYYPDFRTVSDITYDYWGRPITHTYTVFEGYRIFQAILLAFDPEGNLMWDNSLELSNINTLDLTPRVETQVAHVNRAFPRNLYLFGLESLFLIF